MKGKLALLAGFTAGYVLGSRAGRARYNQIRNVASKVWQMPVMQQGRQQVADFAQNRAADAREFVGRKVGEIIAAPKRARSAVSANSNTSKRAAATPNGKRGSGKTATGSANTRTATTGKRTATKSTTQAAAKTARKNTETA